MSAPAFPSLDAGAALRHCARCEGGRTRTRDVLTPVRALSSCLALAAILVVGSFSVPCPAQESGAESNDAPSSSPKVLETLSPTPGGLETGDVVRKALEKSPDLDSVDLDRVRATQSAHRTWVGFVPRLDLSGSYNRLSEVEPPNFDIGGTELENPFPILLDRYSFDAQLAVPVSDYFLRIIPGAKATRTNARVAEYQYQVQRETTALNAIDAWLNWVRARAARVVTNSSVAALQRNLDEVGALADAGIVSEADRLQVRAQLANATVSVRRAEGVLAVARTNVRRALGLSAEEPLEYGEDFFVLPDLSVPSREEVLDQALQNRPEVLALHEIIDMQKSWTRYYAGGRYPKLALSGAATYANPNDRIFPSQDEFNGTWVVGASVRWSPNDYITANEQRLDAKRDLAKFENDLETLEDLLHVEVEDALSFYETSRRSIDAAAEALEAAELGYEDRRKLLQAGEATTGELLASEADLRNAELQLVNAYLDLHLARARLDKVMGRLAPAGEEEE